MNVLRHIPANQRQLIHGAYQVTIPVALDTLEVSDFQSEQLELPFPLLYAVKKRQIEYLCGRFCARLCFEAMGLRPAPPVTFNEDRSPGWPKGYIGSITHTQGWASAVVAQQTQVRGVGVDIENKIVDASPQMTKHICCEPRELTDVEQALGLERSLALTLIFSAKESLYKAVYPWLQRYYGFHAARVRPTLGGALLIELMTDLNDHLLQGQQWPVAFRFLSPELVETLVIEAV